VLDTSLSFRPGAPDRLAFEGLLIVNARTADTDGDGEIDANDATQVFGYDLVKRQLFQITPDRYDTEAARLLKDQLVLVLVSTCGESAVYVYEPLKPAASWRKASARDAPLDLSARWRRMEVGFSRPVPATSLSWWWECLVPPLVSDEPASSRLAGQAKARLKPA